MYDNSLYQMNIVCVKEGCRGVGMIYIHIQGTQISVWSKKLVNLTCVYASIPTWIQDDLALC